MITFLSYSSREFDFNEDFPASVDYNENFNRDRLDVGIKETEVIINDEDEEHQVYYSDYAPEASALMEVEEMEPEEKKGPTLGQVLGKKFLTQKVQYVEKCTRTKYPNQILLLKICPKIKGL